MPLFKVPEDRRISTIETSKGYVSKLLNQPKPTVNKVCRIIDNALGSIPPGAQSKLIWTRMSAIAGKTTLLMSKGDNEWLWDLCNGLFQPEFAQIAIGGILRWRISTRDETWLLYVRETGDIDPMSLKKITISEYWIDDTYQPKKVPRRRFGPPTTADIMNLKGAWGIR
jgi:hypothetical protein